MPLSPTCADCGAPKPSRRHKYCLQCSTRHEMRNEKIRTPSALERKRERDRIRARRLQRESTAGRGYGTAHQKLRKQWKQKVDAGQVVCWRCGGLIPPGAPWDLGHDDYDRTQYKGPEHRRCNRGAVSRVQKQKRQQRRWSEAWW